MVKMLLVVVVLLLLNSALGQLCIDNSGKARESGEEWMENNAFLVKEEDSDRVIADDGWFFRGDMGYWNVPKVEALAALMTEAYEDAAKRTAIAKQSVETATKYDWDNAGAIASNILYNILEE